MPHLLAMAVEWQRQARYFHHMSTRDSGISSRVYFQQMAALAARTAREFRDAYLRDIQTVTTS